MALLMDFLAVKAQARFWRCSLVCGCVTRFSPAERTRVLLSQYLGDELTDLHHIPHSKSWLQFRISVRPRPGAGSGRAAQDR